MSVLAFLERRRPVPADFAEQAARAKSRSALREHYLTGNDLIDRWMDQAGLTQPVRQCRVSRKCFVCLVPIPRQSRTGLCGVHYKAARRPSIGEPIRPRFRVADIITHAASVFGVSEHAITSADRSRHFIMPRFAVCYLARQMTAVSLPALGKILGKRDHSTILHAAHKCEERMAASPEYARQVALVRWLAEGGAPIEIVEPAPPAPPEPMPASEPREWWDMDDDELISLRIAEHNARGGDFIEVRA